MRESRGESACPIAPSAPITLRTPFPLFSLITPLPNSRFNTYASTSLTYAKTQTLARTQKQAQTQTQTQTQSLASHRPARPAQPFKLIVRNLNHNFETGHPMITQDVSHNFQAKDPMITQTRKRALEIGHRPVNGQTNCKA